MKHTAGTTPYSNRWTRDFTIDSASNRLTNNSIGSNSTSAETYDYDARGNMTGGMNQLTTTGSSHAGTMLYNELNRLEKVIITTTQTAYYQYDSSGQRVRKVIYDSSSDITQTRKYVGSWELYVKETSTSITTERETLNVMDDTARALQIDSDTLNSTQTQRYQFSNHLVTATLELDENADGISYEGYYSFGSTSF